MGISRLVILGLLALAGWWLWKKVKQLSAEQARERLSQATPMVCCEHCRLHLPEPDAIRHQNRWYCSRAHAKAGPGQP
ncbi:PP0621 family protein [Thiopseudomonas denitrificans]|uniref:MYND finger n=1 Tax=Thiopseudomonas denitrificans TaxID=1501432 RepID=A0A4R6U4C1_9GAMM|nr:PP0621 family protein [Thiopseudomonas denitrificans]TDQ39389.1 uncharacterized protein DFQ45_10280 [Thiopseudomonas denitrificans]